MHMIHFVGFFDYTVILTYISLIVSVFGITQSIHGDYKSAIFCLAFSGLCDAFDGRIARTKKNRTEDEKNFGIQLDSLCDVICFGIFPAQICYLLGVRGILGIFIVCFYCLCAVIRLGYFNVLENKRQQAEEGGNKVYHGLPVTSIALILPVTFLTQLFLPEFVFMVLLHAVLALTGFLFILDFPLRKPSLKAVLAMILIGAVTVGTFLIYTNFKIPRPNDESNPVIDEIIEEIYDTEES